MEGALKGFLGAAGEVTCSGGSADAWSVTLELAAGEGVEGWVERLCEFLRAAGVRRGTFRAVFPDGWRPGEQWRRVDVTAKPGPVAAADPAALFVLHCSPRFGQAGCVPGRAGEFHRSAHSQMLTLW